MNNQETLLNVYRVRVGHAEVIVKARSTEEAIAFARRQLALEMPLLYDIIRALDSNRFDVLQAA